MIATFFRWRVAAEAEEEFRRRWNDATRFFLARGSKGSSLWRDDEGCLCAFALWPDRAIRQSAFAEADPAQLKSLRSLIDETLSSIDMDQLDNHWRLEGQGGQSTEK